MAWHFGCEPPPSAHGHAAPSDAQLTQALFRVIAAHGWRGVTPARLAAESGLTAAELLARYPSRLGLLKSFADVVMDEVAVGTVPGQGARRATGCSMC